MNALSRPWLYEEELILRPQLHRCVFVCKRNDIVAFSIPVRTETIKTRKQCIVQLCFDLETGKRQGDLFFILMFEILYVQIKTTI